MKRSLPDAKDLNERVSVAERISAWKFMDIPDAVSLDRLHLFALYKRLKKFADKAAARPDADQYLMANFGLLSSVATLRDAVADMVETASDDDVRRLERVLRAAFYIGSLAPKDLRAAVAKQLNERMQRVTDARHPGSDKINARIAKLYKLGWKLIDIGKDKEVGLSPDAVDERRRNMGIPSRRSRRKKSKK
jgi:hypothetical protein